MSANAGRASAVGVGRKRSAISVLLVQPPLTDPTAPYHSISYLAGAAAAAGYRDVTCVDANVEALNELAAPALVADVISRAEAVVRQLEADGIATRRDQLRYTASLAAQALDPGDVSAAIAALRDPQRFYDFPTYSSAVRTVQGWLRALPIGHGLPGQYDGLAVASAALDVSRTSELLDPEALQTVVAAFLPYFEGTFQQHIVARRYDVVGLSVSYSSQLPFAVWLARFVRERMPDVTLLVGGTEVSDVAKYGGRDVVATIFPGIDHAVLGEGESAFVELLDDVRRGDATAPRPAAAEACIDGRYEDVEALPAPRYDVWDWSQYWSPEPVALYSPTRGCYWNRCTFCDYGLNGDAPTSPSRERSPARTVEDLTAIHDLARVVYFAVDAMSPRFLRSLAGALSEADLDLAWAAELRLERTLDDAGARRLRDSGCIAISFGYESGSQRILDLIDKGVRIGNVPEVLDALASAGIGVQMMGFTGFPSETVDEARRTYELLADAPDRWAIAGIGSFALTAGSIVAKEPARFGIDRVSAYELDDIPRALYWVSNEGEQADTERGDLGELASELARFEFDRPFVGGIDSTHSLLYFARNGARLVGEDERDAAMSAMAVRREVIVPFAGLSGFCSPADVASRAAALRLDEVSDPRGALAAWLDEPVEQATRGAAALRIDVLDDFTLVDVGPGSEDRSDAFHRLSALLAERLAPLGVS